MTNDSLPKVSTGGFGLMAFGASDAWDLTIDESLDQDDKWEAELEGPNIYISYCFEELQVVRHALDYLQTRILKAQEVLSNNSTTQCGLTLGKFGTSKITLIWDDENFDRCFIIVGPTSNSAIRLSLFENDIKMLIKAFQKAVNQLPDES